MAQIYAGTAFGQVIGLHSEDRKKEKNVYGAMKRDPVVQVSHYAPTGMTFYATNKSVNSVRRGQSN